MEIKAQVKSIEKLEDYFFLVPDYQREYVWQPDDQVEQFIIDIDNEFDLDSENQKSYFIGSIIIVENNNKYDVIDGQQRLTTIILSLCAFRDLMKGLELDRKQKKYFQTVEELLSDFDISTDKTQLRLELQYEESKDFIQKLITSEKYDDDITPSIKKMQQAYEKLKSHFESYLKESQNSLTKFMKYFLTKIELVVIESKELSSALKIFETINQRGAGLNAMDLVKNLLFSKANKEDFQSIKNTWKTIVSNLQDCGEDQSPLRFLRYYLMSRYHDGIIREDDIYKWIISPEGKKATNYESEPLAFAKELDKISKRYSNLVKATELMTDGGDYPNTTNIGFINKYKSRQHLILMLSLDTTAKTEVIEYLATQIESFFFFSNSLRIQAKYNESLFVRWAQKLRGASTIEEIKVALESTMEDYLRKLIPKFKAVFLHKHHGAYNPLYRVRYILGKVENTVRAKVGLPLKGHAFYYYLQLEHILPQTPLDNTLPEEFEDLEDYRSYVYKMGNVVLLEGTINQALCKFNNLQENWFDQKQNEYRNSDLVLANLLDDEYLIGKDTKLNKFKSSIGHDFIAWTKESIDNRQKILLELVFDTWRLNGQRLDIQ